MESVDARDIALYTDLLPHLCAGKNLFSDDDGPALSNGYPGNA